MTEVTEKVRHDRAIGGVLLSGPVDLSSPRIAEVVDLCNQHGKRALIVAMQPGGGHVVRFIGTAFGKEILCSAQTPDQALKILRTWARRPKAAKPRTRR